ncbi:MAG TPA: hypothetical protein VNN79_06550 [Actinomycetota bacterium]|nr:hypothetical protein [Actinomycetota bacterium]
MGGLIGRRPLFFLACAVICALLIAPTPAEFRWVNLTMIGLALFWAVMLSAEELARRRRRSRTRRRTPPPEPEPEPEGEPAVPSAR